MAPEVLAADEGSTFKLTHRLWAGDLSSSLSGPFHSAVLNMISPIASDQRERERKREMETQGEKGRKRERVGDRDRKRKRERNRQRRRVRQRDRQRQRET